MNSASMIHTELKYSENELQSTCSRLAAAKEAHLAANHNAAIKAKSVEKEQLEAEKIAKNARMRTLTLQADSRTRLAIKKGEVVKKKTEISSMCDPCGNNPDIILTSIVRGSRLETNNQRFQELTGMEADASSMEQAMERAIASVHVFPSGALL